MKILSLSGFIPEQICDTVRFIQYEGDFGISHYCGYVSDYISRVLNDPDIDGAVFPRSCDSSRVIAAYLANCGKFIYQMPVPACTGDAAVLYLSANIKQYQRAVEQYYGITINDIEDRVERIHKRNAGIEKWYKKLGETLPYSRYLAGIHKMLGKPLGEQNISDELVSIFAQNELKDSVHGKRVYLVGSFLSNHAVTEVIEQAGMCIVGDNLTESKRLFSAPLVSAGNYIYESIAKSILQNKLSPTQNCFTKILADDLNEVKEKEAEGVIFVIQNYCEPYEYLYSVYKKMLDDIHIPALKLNLANSTDSKRFAFVLEAFADCL